MRSLKAFIAENLIHTKIFEMAKALDEYENQIESMIAPISIHVILILKHNQEGNESYVKHWKDELLTFFDTFMNITLKTKNTYKAKKKHIEKILYKELKLNEDVDKLIKLIYLKFKHEGYDLKDKKVYDEFIPVMMEYQNNYLEKIIDIIAEQDPMKADDFVENL